MVRPYFHGQQQQEDLQKDNYTPITYSSVGVAQQQATTFLADLSNQFLHLIDQSESKKHFVCPFTVTSLFLCTIFAWGFCWIFITHLYKV